MYSKVVVFDPLHLIRDRTRKRCHFVADSVKTTVWILWKLKIIKVEMTTVAVEKYKFCEHLLSANNFLKNRNSFCSQRTFVCLCYSRHSFALTSLVVLRQLSSFLLAAEYTKLLRHWSKANHITSWLVNTKKLELLLVEHRMNSF